MITINENYLKLQDSYLFSTIAQKVEKFTKENPNKKVMKLGGGDVTLPKQPMTCYKKKLFVVMVQSKDMIF